MSRTATATLYFSRRQAALIATAALLLRLTASGICQADFTVPVADPAYSHLDNLIAYGLVHAGFQATRPLSRTDFRRAAQELKAALPDKGEVIRPDWLQTSVSYFLHRFEGTGTNGHSAPDLIRLRLFESLSLELLGHNAESRPFPGPWISAQVHPFRTGEDGKRIVRGANAALEMSHTLTLGSVAGLFYHGRTYFTEPHGASLAPASLDQETLRMYLILSKWTFNLLIGRDSMVWGPGRRSNLILSRQATAVGSFSTLPLIKLSNRRPVTLPWVFAHLGPLHYEVFVARLRETRSDFARPYFVGKRLDFKPAETVEIGFSHAFILGGENFPVSFTFWDALAEFFFSRIKQRFILNIDFDKLQLQNNIANHVMGFDLLFRLPGWRQAEFYHEVYFDDFTLNLNTTLHRNLAYLGGLYLPRVTASGRVGLRAEFSHTSNIFYQSTPPMTAGFTYNNRILGSDLGPRGNALFLAATIRQSARTEWTFSVDLQNRRALQPSLPHENRLVLGGALLRRVKLSLSLEIDLRLQRTWAFAHTPGDTRNAFLAGFRLHFQNKKSR